MFEAMERGELRTLFVIGENPAQSEADQTKARKLLTELDCLIVQDIYLTKTAELADVVLPGSASSVELSGTVTNSERRVQIVRKALDPPGDARDDNWIITELARRLDQAWEAPEAERIWDELRSLSPMHAGMSYERLEANDGLQWPCRTLDDPGAQFLHGRLWEDPIEGPPAPFSVTPFVPPVDELTDEFPIRLTTGRRLESYNTGAQSNMYRSPLHRGRASTCVPRTRTSSSDRGRDRADHFATGIGDGAGPDRSLAVPRARVDDVPLPRAGRDQRVDDRRDHPKSGTAEFKATAIRVEKVSGNGAATNGAATNGGARSRAGEPV